MSESLERLVAKVASGERLSEDELATLQRHAHAGSRLLVRLAWGHALLQAGEARQALVYLERLVRDFPSDVQCHLALARAHTVLDQGAPAEAALKRALALSPQDPEALKALALFAMERGELASARARIDQVLRLDPLDPEAQLVASELEARADVRLSADADTLVARVLPVLRPGDFHVQAPLALRRPGPAGLQVFYVESHPELLPYVPHAALAQLDVSLDALDDAAWRNLEARPPVLELDPDSPLWALATQDGHDAARLLLGRVRGQLPGARAWHVQLGRREVVVGCAADDAEASRRLDALPTHEGGIEGRFHLTAEGALTRR